MNDAARVAGSHVMVRLRDGQSVAVREAVDADERAIGDFLQELGLEARTLRFFSGGIDMEEMTHRLAQTGRDRVGLLALDAEANIVGHAVYIELRPGRAEVAVEVADRLHGEGLGTVLIERLAELAEQRGITVFEAQVLPQNRAMLDVFRDGFDADVKWSEGAYKVELKTSAWREARELYDAMFEGQG
jgi:L-amino acid N-acyltransferase YncA